MKHPLPRAFLLLAALLLPPGCARHQLYPIDQILPREITPQADQTVLIEVGPAISQYTRRVETLSDRIVVRFERCEYCKDGGQITIANPQNLPIYFADETQLKQVYPVNELVSALDCPEE